MNQKQCKLMKKWCTKIWNESTDKDRDSFVSLEAFINKVKSDSKVQPKLMKFIKYQMQEIHITAEDMN